MDLFQDTDTLFASSSLEVNPPPEKKRKHKITEQKGRQKINDQINELKGLLPECKYVSTTKASVLECAVNSLRRLQTASNQLLAGNKKLQNENRILRQELEKYCPIELLNLDGELTELNNAPTTDEGDRKPGDSNTNTGDFNPNADGFGVGEQQTLPGFVNELLLAETAAANFNMMQQRFNNREYVNNSGLIDFSSSSPEASSSPQDSPQYVIPNMMNMPNFPHGFSMADLNNLAHFNSAPYNFSFPNQQQQNSDTISNDSSDSYYKVTKRKLLALILLMVPIFLSFDSMQSDVRGYETAGRSRTLMDYSIPSSGDMFAAIYYFDLARFLMYFVLGVMGVKWTANTVLWAAKLQNHVPFYRFNSA